MVCYRYARRDEKGGFVIIVFLNPFFPSYFHISSAFLSYYNPTGTQQKVGAGSHQAWLFSMHCILLKGLNTGENPGKNNITSPLHFLFVRFMLHFATLDHPPIGTSLGDLGEDSSRSCRGHVHRGGYPI